MSPPPGSLLEKIYGKYQTAEQYCYTRYVPAFTNTGSNTIQKYIFENTVVVSGLMIFFMHGHELFKFPKFKFCACQLGEKIVKFHFCL